MHDTAQTMKITGARFPGRYIQATGLIARLGVETKSLGTNGFAILDCALAEMLEIEMTAGAGDDIALSFHTHGGECSEDHGDICQHAQDAVCFAKTFFTNKFR